jgi:phosphoribosylamine--glycine ligase
LPWHRQTNRPRRVKVLLVGGGGREHALAWRIAASDAVDALFVSDDNAGFLPIAERIAAPTVEAAQAAGIDLVVVGPEGPLAEGLADRMRAAGIAVFGPSAAAAQLESSKRFAKAFMDRHSIPTAAWSVHTDAAGAHAAVTGPCVVKADGLAAGKGVVVADSADVAHAAIDHIFEGAFGAAGHQIVIEERLTGPELSVLALCDGNRAVPLMPCRDHKRRFDRGMGPNTGGMGAICPSPDATPELLQVVQTDVLDRVVQGMCAEGTPFRGVLYAGLMLTPDGPKVLEFNVRFGDPECQPLMLMMGEDIVPWMAAAASGTLPSRPIRWREGAACCVVMVAGAYPSAVAKGMLIHDVPEPDSDLVVFFAGARRDGDKVVTAGGRVLGVTAHGDSLDAARARAYETVRAIRFDTAAWRSDIGQVETK